MATSKLKLPRCILQSTVDSLYQSLIASGARALFVGGSFVRECPSCGDIDIAVLFQPGALDAQASSLYAWLNRDFGYSTSSRGPRLAHGMIYPKQYGVDSVVDQVQLDLWFSNNEAEWGGLCLFVAGSGNFNIHMRVASTRKGYKLSQYGLTYNGERISTPTQEGIFDQLKLPYVPYKERNL